jgi:CO/xanthine dehydrogenase Mo-binding subunit
VNEPVRNTVLDDARRRVSATMPFAIDRRIPGTLHAAVVRSQLPHGRIHEVDADEALAVPGVERVVVARDLLDHPGVANLTYGETRFDQPVLAHGRVRYVGEPIAVVLATTREAARRAARLVFVDDEELPFETDHRRAGDPDAPQLHEDHPGNHCGDWRLLHGDPKVGWDEAERIFEHTYDTPAASHVPLEPHAATASWTDGRLEVWTGTQSPYNVRKRLVHVFGLPEAHVRVRGDNLGGGFGSKTDARIEPLVSAVALVAGAPVRLELDREEVFKTVAKHAARVRIRTGVREDGTFTAREIDIVYNAGAYANTTPRATRTGMLRSPGPYRIPHVEARVVARYTNTVPTGPFRGAMTGQVCWAHESTIDEIARDLGLDPIELRRRNVLQEGDRYATGEPMHDMRYLELLDALERELGGPGEPSRPGLVRGVGVALVIKSTRTPSRSEARVRLEPDGRVLLLTSSVDMGQGAQVALARELAGVLGIPLELVDVTCADTEHTPFDTTTSSSRTTFCMGNAVRDAAHALLAELRCVVAGLTDLSVDEVITIDGGLTAGDRRFELSELAATHGPLTVHGVYETPDGMGELDPETTQGVASVHWHQGGVGVEVEVDTETGTVRVVRVVGASFAGRVLDPLKVRQQAEGGMIFGLGQALYEEMEYDAGQLTNPNMADYLIPSLLDSPVDIRAITLSDDAPDADAHGVGENTVPPMAPAIANAVHDAVGVRIRTLPITAERVLRAIRADQEVAS